MAKAIEVKELKEQVPPVTSPTMSLSNVQLQPHAYQSITPVSIHPYPQVKALGKTLIEELEKAALQKETLDNQINTITAEKDHVNSALKTAQVCFFPSPPQCSAVALCSCYAFLKAFLQPFRMVRSFQPPDLLNESQK